MTEEGGGRPEDEERGAKEGGGMEEGGGGSKDGLSIEGGEEVGIEGCNNLYSPKRLSLSV